ncbi:MAG: chemotaxis protein CheX, partial [Planctomycetota bacterium]
MLNASDPYAADPYAADPYAADPYAIDQGFVDSEFANSYSADLNGGGGFGVAESVQNPAAGAVARSPEAGDLRTLADQLFADMLGLSVADGDESPNGGRTAAISITGERSACLLVIVSEKLSRSVASCMFDVPDAGLDDSQIEDAVGEVVNILGGNVKPMLGDDLQLSLPRSGAAREVATSGASQTVTRVRIDG